LASFFFRPLTTSIKEYGGSLALPVYYSSQYPHHRQPGEFSIGEMGNIRPVLNNMAALRIVAPDSIANKKHPQISRKRGWFSFVIK